MDGFEKRKNRRLAIRFSLLCRRLGDPAPELRTGTVLNVGAGGLYFETTATEFEPGNLAEVRFTVPPETGRLEFGGTMHGIGTVLRTETIETSRTGMRACPVYGVALQFSRPPKLSQ